MSAPQTAELTAWSRLADHRRRTEAVDRYGWNATADGSTTRPVVPFRALTQLWALVRDRLARPPVPARGAGATGGGAAAASREGAGC